MTKEDQAKERKDVLFSSNLADEKQERATLKRRGEQSFSQEGAEPKPDLFEERQTRGELAALSLDRRHEVLHETLDTDPFATHIDLPALGGWPVATDPDLDESNDTPPLLFNDEEFLSLYGNHSLGEEQRIQQKTRFDTRDLIRALLPHDLAEEIVSSSSLSIPPPALLRESSTSIRSLGSSLKDDLAYPTSTIPLLSSEPERKSSKPVTSSKARDLLHHCFFEEKGQGVVYAALVEMESRRCLASLCLDDGEDGTFQEAAIEENAMVLWVLFRTMKSADVRGNLEEVLISLERQYHMIVPLSAHSTVFLYVAFRKDWGTPPLMRLYFRRLREDLERLLGGEKVS